MISNLIACGKWDRCAIASQLLRLSSVVSWAEIQVEEDDALLMQFIEI